MSFQSTVNKELASGVVGEIITTGPIRANPGILSSTSAANNVIGRAFRHVSGSDTDVTADAAGVFAGILAHPKSYPLFGAANPLTPSLTLPNEVNVMLLIMGYMIVDLSQDAPATGSRVIGSEIWYQDTTGILVGVVAGTASVTGYTKVPNAVIVDNNLADGTPGLAKIKLTN